MEPTRPFYVYETNQDVPSDPWLSEGVEQSVIEQHSIFDLSSSTSLESVDFDGYGRGSQPPGNISDPQKYPTVVGEASFSLTALNTLLVSTAFHAGATPCPNTFLLSSDGVTFYVHDETILNRCPKAFEGFSTPLFPTHFSQQIIQLDAPSAELNIILHALYGTPAGVHSPDTTTLINAVDRMPAYSISPLSLIRPSAELYGLLLAHAPICPLEIYALAARHGLATLATSASSYLLSYDLTTITDDMAERMGPVYFMKLGILHMERHGLLRRIFLNPPYPHPPTDDCSFKEQAKLTRIWALLSTQFVWDRQADLSSNRMQTALNSLAEPLTCKACKKVLDDKIRDALKQWASTKVNCHLDGSDPALGHGQLNRIDNMMESLML